MDPTQFMQQGNAAFSRGKYGEALRFYSKALEGLREDPGPLADLYGNIGNVYGITGKAEEAKACYEKAITLLRRLEDYGRLGITYANLGNLYLDEGDSEKALHFYKQGDVLLEQAEQWEPLSVLYGNLSRLYLRQEKPQSALSFAEKGIALARKLDHPKLLADALQKLAKAKEALGEVSAARALSESAYALYQHNRDEMGCAATLYHQVALYEQEGDLEAAIACLREVIAIDEKYKLPKLDQNRARLKNLQARCQTKSERP